ncbi:hypothetical protein PV08_09482 [Exophiala spinifera]|uniref:NAD-dependent epimerase/dehydratase domain-containing protein n=1 Tax=Exophiala spinifera TaxID=91928 RepID=A0A0D1YBA1_9EURO|nr:uncharacterized protein PV08_09482 [Exophiala spinifera]KIW12206.1 hypothetical protein PV08_09482 [Exophiala spinifera]
MPKVFLTGANGFLATHILSQLVENGYEVTGTVRTQSKAEDVFVAHPSFKSKVKLVVVPDLSAAGAYDQILKETRFDYIIHTASPVPDGSGKDFDEDFLRPAVQGNLELLNAALTYSKALTHFCFTGSVVSVTDVTKPFSGKALTANDWNEVDPDVARKAQHGGVSYMYAKTLAEKALWKFVEDKTPDFTVSVILSPFIIGPPLQRLDEKAFGKGRTNLSSDVFYDNFLRPGTDGKPLFSAYIDVRDLAILHVRALTEASDKNRRILLANPEPLFAGTVLEILREEYPQLRERLSSVPGAAMVASKEEDTEHPYRIDDSDTRSVFGDKIYRSLRETVIDTANRLLEIE